MKNIFSILALASLSVSLAIGDVQPRPNIYSPAGKRDPFRAPAASTSRDIDSALSPTERFSLEQYQLRAIIKGIGKNRAMFEDPEGKSFILFEGDVIGREKATVSRVLDKGVIVTERTFNYLGEESLLEKVL